EPVITDGRAGRIIRDVISPRFKIENYEEGTQEAVKHLQDYILSGEPALDEEESLAPNTMIIPLIFAGLILIYLASFLGRTKKFWPGGVVGAGLGVIFGKPSDWLILGLILGAWGLFLDYIFSKNYKKLKKLGESTGFWSSRGGFGGGGSGRGGGGFGGGSSGGGGASGGW
ncbi:MAG: TPM domain-containing protein, partial [Patescibacteria group bacterium]